MSHADYDPVEGGQVVVSGSSITITYEDEQGRSVVVEYEIIPNEE